MRGFMTGEEQRRRDTAHAVFPYVKRFYDGYLEGEEREPFYKPSSRV